MAGNINSKSGMAPGAHACNQNAHKKDLEGLVDAQLAHQSAVGAELAREVHVDFHVVDAGRLAHLFAPHLGPARVRALHAGEATDSRRFFPFSEIL